MIDELRRHYPELVDNPTAMAMFCGLLCDQGKEDEALALGLAAMALAPSDMEVRDLVCAALGDDVPHWHVPMLRDSARNDCYSRAIERMVKPGMLVFEIGSGVGLLALLAARAGADVVTCETNPMVAAMAAEIFRRNGLEHRITLLRKSSTEVMPGDLPRPADLLMSELFDDGLFGEGIMTYVDDARRRLLRPGAAVLPGRAAIRCALTARSNRRPRRGDETIHGFDMSPLAVLARPGIVPGGVQRGATRRSAPLSVMAMDFEAAGDFGATRQRASFVSTGGPVDGIAQWLHVDFGAGVVFENDPIDGDASHWPARFIAFPEPIETTPGQRVEVEIRLVRRQLLMKLAA